jgi:hypothetical protein
VPRVLVPHERDVWREARVEKQWRHEGRWRLAAYYYVGVGMQHYRVYDADQCRPVSAAELQHDDQRDAAPGHEQPERHREMER